MGKLRKIGKKIKKGVKKLLGGKFGKILGGIGLAMMFWGGANAMFGKMDWFQGLKSKLPKMDNFATTTVTESTEIAGNAITGGPDIAGLSKAGPGTITSTKTVPLTDAKFKDLDIGGKIAKVGVEGAELAYKGGEKIAEGLIPGEDFVSDVGESLVTSAAITALSGDEGDEDFGGRGIVVSQPQQEQIQQAYVADVRNNISPRVATNFQELNRTLLFGTLSPNYLIGNMS
tara:strand:+ start:1536 stop:2225 length:690 start_codon:yes stop_codon:yes gene_type:complete